MTLTLDSVCFICARCRPICLVARTPWTGIMHTRNKTPATAALPMRFTRRKIATMMNNGTDHSECSEIAASGRRCASFDISVTACLTRARNTPGGARGGAREEVCRGGRGERGGGVGKIVVQKRDSHRCMPTSSSTDVAMTSTTPHVHGTVIQAVVHFIVLVPYSTRRLSCEGRLQTTAIAYPRK